MKKKFLSALLAIVLVLSLIPALVVSADEPGAGYFKAYADAAEGELLYKADFRGDSHWVDPGTETAAANAGWNWNTQEKVLTATADPEDPGKATFTLEAQGNTAWGADLVDFPLEPDYSYTILFTVTRTRNAPIGLLFDGHHGAYVQAAKGRLQKNGSALSGHDYVDYGETVPAKRPSEDDPSVQEYAITIADVRYDGEGDNAIKKFNFILCVKGTDGNWIRIDEGVPVSNDARDTLGLYFYSYQTTGVEVSDVEVYKGLAITLPEPPQPDEPEETEETEWEAYYKAYADADDGELIYRANFNGDEHWVDPGTETGTANAGWDGHWNDPAKGILTGTIDAENPGKATFVLEGSQQNSAWGADLVDFPLEPGYSYTVKFAVTRTGEVPIGLLIDGHHGGYFYSSRARVQKNGNALGGHSFVNYSGSDIPGKGSPFGKQEYAITIEDVEYETVYETDSETGEQTESKIKLFTFTLYVKGADGNWIEIDDGEPVTTETRDTLGLYFYSYHNTSVTVSNVEVYKGVALTVAEPEEPEDPGDKEEEVTTRERQNYAPPTLVTEEATAAPAETTGKKGGCGSIIGGSALILFAVTAGIAAVTVKRKKED